MAVITPGPPTLSGELSLFHTTDPLLANLPIFVFHGLAASVGATSSRIQVHIFTTAGHASYPRLSVSPNSPFYSAVTNLPREEQGDEVCRGLAFGLKKYFSELPENVKKTWATESKAATPSALFQDDHVAILATRLARVENSDEITEYIKQAFGEKSLSWIDVDVVLPPGSIKDVSPATPSQNDEGEDEDYLLRQKYGKYSQLVASLGDVAFLPTSTIKRAPSKASTVGRSASFLKHQKENVRKELLELLETEGNYAERIKELHHLAISLGSDLDSTLQQQLRSIFPSSIESIADLSTGFLSGLNEVLQSTEHDAMRDIASLPEDEAHTKQAFVTSSQDKQGVSEVANFLCDWLPRFRDCYGQYLKDHVQCAQLLREFLKTGDVRICEALSGVGEQKLTSLLIEPVQRLPRYTLYIDTIIKQLPSRHSAIKPLLRAKDIVSDICDQSSSDASNVVDRLQSLVSDWPTNARVSGRFVTAVDCIELISPYCPNSCDGEPHIMLLFTDALVFLQSFGTKPTTARNLLTQIEFGQPPTLSTSVRPGTPPGLKFLRRIRLDAVDYLESSEGRLLHLLEQGPTMKMSDPSEQAHIENGPDLRLEGSYERKVEKLGEEITKARVEGRFSEGEREGSKWEVRATDPTADASTLFSAVFEDSNAEHVVSRRGTASIRFIVDIDRHSQKPRAGQNGIRTVVCVTPMRDGLWRLTFDSIDGEINREHTVISDVVPTIRKRLMGLIAAKFAIDNSTMTVGLLAKNADILQSINMRIKNAEVGVERVPSQREKVQAPRSPRKLLSSFLSSSGSGTRPPSLLKKELPPLPAPDFGQRYPSSIQSKPGSRESRPSSRDQPTPKSTTSAHPSLGPSDRTQRLEETLSTYILALQARKGNIVGRSLRMRAGADELAVNELYNSLLEDPDMMAAAAQASVDVLFAAFEKFLNIAWREAIGQLLPLSLLQTVQAKADSLFPADFDKYFRSTIEAMCPENKRAFKSIMNLLSDLLDGTGNDSDRGTLTAAFAEVLVPEGNAHDYIALIDRFVDDPDTYFGEPLEDVHRATEGGTSLHKRGRSTNSASVTSNTSSLRRKFGFSTLLRDSSKPETDSKVSLVLRSLSKSARGDVSAGNSISKGTLSRSHSIDADGRLTQRPLSQDGKSAKGEDGGEDLSFTSLSSNHRLGLSTIGEHPCLIPKQPPRKKRRSSLSDLKFAENDSGNSPLWQSPVARPSPMAQRSLADKSLPNSPVPSAPSSKDSSGRFDSPTKAYSRSRLPPSFRKENLSGSPVAPDIVGTPLPNKTAKDEVVVTARTSSNLPTLISRPSSPQKGLSSLPGKGGGLLERRDAGNAMKKPSLPQDPTKPVTASPVDSGSPKKLRMQSPQKLRERLHNEQSSLTTIQSSLQDELSLIGNELSSTPIRGGSTRINGRPVSQVQSSSMDLAARVLKMEGQLPQQIEETTSRITSIQADLASSLVVSESKCKKLDDLYREANGENEALYSRFNDELSRILKAVRGGDGVEELKNKLKESQEEAMKLKRENGRLKRENVGLRSQLKE